MKKNSIKIIASIMLMIMLIAMASYTFAASADNGPGQFTGADGLNVGEFKNMGQKVIGILKVFGSMLSVIVLIVLGIKYMMGSAEEKAEYKKTMIPYLVGAALIFSAPFIAQAIYNFFV